MSTKTPTLCSENLPVGIKLFFESQISNQFFVPLCVFALEISQDFFPLGDHFEKTAAGVVVFCIFFEMACELFDLLSEQRNLDFRGTRVLFVSFARFNHFGFFLLREGHRMYAFSAYFVDFIILLKRIFGKE
jgi:hypothetical protein